MPPVSVDVRAVINPCCCCGGCGGGGGTGDAALEGFNDGVTGVEAAGEGIDVDVVVVVVVGGCC